LRFDSKLNGWISKEGLFYSAKRKNVERGGKLIPQNKVEHVLDHTIERPGRENHTIFSVERGEVISLIDEAWARRGSPVQGDTWRWEVEMGRPIGTNGETVLRLIVNPQTKAVNTAYPISR
jgi:filamentous hemagglutinin